MRPQRLVGPRRGSISKSVRVGHDGPACRGGSIDPQLMRHSVSASPTLGSVALWLAFESRCVDDRPKVKYESEGPGNDEEAGEVESGGRHEEECRP